MGKSDIIKCPKFFGVLTGHEARGIRRITVIGHRELLGASKLQDYISEKLL